MKCDLILWMLVHSNTRVSITLCCSYPIRFWGSHVYAFRMCILFAGTQCCSCGCGTWRTCERSFGNGRCIGCWSPILDSCLGRYNAGWACLCCSRIGWGLVWKRKWRWSDASKAKGYIAGMSLSFTWVSDSTVRPPHNKIPCIPVTCNLSYRRFFGFYTFWVVCLNPYKAGKLHILPLWAGNLFC